MTDSETRGCRGCYVDESVVIESVFYRHVMWMQEKV
jgi:hypothetical protein